MKIDKKLLKHWNACESGINSFNESFPKGAPYHEVMLAADVKREFGNSNWLFDKVHEHYLGNPDLIESEKLLNQGYVAACQAACSADPVIPDGISSDDLEVHSSTGEGANNSSTGYGANNSSTGEGANNSSTGNYANNSSTGYGANNSSTGEGANNSSTGNYANNSSTGY
ncbi:MAG: hypothetical protein KGI50_07220, partial [Patescibacteria group bacterium]|nr:hypothetical protein [Patescibacteria group bacterium]